jgi:hypothetical protein
MTIPVPDVDVVVHPDHRVVWIIGISPIHETVRAIDAAIVVPRDIPNVVDIIVSPDHSARMSTIDEPTVDAAMIVTHAVPDVPKIDIIPANLARPAIAVANVPKIDITVPPNHRSRYIVATARTRRQIDPIASSHDHMAASRTGRCVYPT